MANFQREGASSNTEVGNSFQNLALKALNSHGLELSRSFSIEIGISQVKRPHLFDFGDHENKIIVECKSHKWTVGGNVPSAKITCWDQSMFYFSMVPKEYRKIFFILKDVCPRRRESLASYYRRTHGHMIPIGVEFWECDEFDGSVQIL
jgi:hypothetical protein